MTSSSSAPQTQPGVAVAAPAPLIARAADLPREGWDDPARGAATWFTFFSAGRTPTSHMTAGLMEIACGQSLRPHRHQPPEIYFIAAGAGVVRVDGVARRVEAGDAVFIPGDAEHGLTNDGIDVLRVFYVFRSTVSSKSPTASTTRPRRPHRAFSDPSGSENRPLHLFQRIIFVRQVCNLAG